MKTLPKWAYTPLGAYLLGLLMGWILKGQV
mgnify:CR=1 FL=1